MLNSGFLDAEWAQMQDAAAGPAPAHEEGQLSGLLLILKGWAVSSAVIAPAKGHQVPVWMVGHNDSFFTFDVQ